MVDKISLNSFIDELVRLYSKIIGEVFHLYQLKIRLLQPMFIGFAMT